MTSAPILLFQPLFRHARWRRALFLCALIALFPVMTAQAACPAWKATLFLPGPEKSQTDFIFRPLRNRWQAAMESSLDFAPAPGRGGSYAWSRVQREKPDGCLFAGLAMPAYQLLALAPDRMYTADELIPILIFASAPNALWVAESSPFLSLSDFIAFARQQDEQGVQVVIAGVGSYTDQHLASLQLNREVGIRSLYMPLIGSEQASEAVRDGKASACWGYALPPESMPGMRPLAVAAERRSPALPQTPIFREEQADFVNLAHFGVAVSAASSEKTRLELLSSIASLARDPLLRQEVERAGLAFTPLAGAEAAAFSAAQEDAAKALVEEYALLPAR
ncbi:MAG: hypothetical protein LBH65_02905 [Desulfovibrio sp.]|jgi:tripartite-type tricarboxylate transporter receptor subunit TctC|nr:hypothetical protein [Desulfovibrio sp.]